jgi:beta-lactamase regulating signal transducer with metallopeptidase domain
MLVVVETVNRLAAAAGPMVLATLWQSALLAAVVALLAVALRRAAPAVRYWLWQIVAIKLLLMPFWTSTLNIGWPIPAPPAVATIPESKNLAQPEVTATVPLAATAWAPPYTPAPPSTPGQASEPSFLGALTWSAWLLLAWAAMVVMQFLQLVGQRHRLAKLLRSATAAEGDILSLVQRLGRSLSLKGTPSVLLTMENCSPFVQGIVHPRLVLPKSLLERLSPSQLRQVVLHELAHLRRRDLVWCWIPQIARMLFFFNPVAHLVRRRIELESELACDQQAMRSECGAPADYAQTLLLVMSHLSEPRQLQRSSAS